MLISHFPQVVPQGALEQSEPSLITRHTTELAQAYNKYLLRAPHHGRERPGRARRRA